MNEFTITFETFRGALRHQWRVLLLSVCAFTAVGLCGAFFAAGQTPAAGNSGADALTGADLSLLEEDETWFPAALEALQTGSDAATQYLAALSKDATVTEEQAAQLETLVQAVTDFRTETLSPIQEVLARPNAIYVPVTYLDTLAADYARQLERVRSDLIAAAASAEIVKTMAAPNTENEITLSAYNTLLSQAAQYGALQQQQQTYLTLLERLETNRAEVAAACRDLRQTLRQAAADLDELSAEISEAAGEIAGENRLLLTVSEGEDGTALFTLSHAHGDSTPRETFLVITLFSALVGLCAGGFFALCRESRRDSRREPPAPKI